MAASYREIGTAKWRAPAEIPAAGSAPASSVGGAVAVGQPMTASASTLGLHLPTTVQAGLAAMPAETEESPVVADVVIAAPLVEKKVCLCVCLRARARVCVTHAGYPHLRCDDSPSCTGVLCAHALHNALHATHRGLLQVGPQDFDLLQVIGQGGYGKVRAHCCSEHSLCIGCCVCEMRITLPPMRVLAQPTELTLTRAPSIRCFWCERTVAQTRTRFTQ